METQTVTRQNTTSTLVLFFLWLFVESTAHIVRTWKFFLSFGLRIFSVPLLVRTFFSPWHRYWYGYPKGFDLKALFSAVFGNLMSRAIGVILRTFIIFLGLFFELVIIVVGTVFLVFWVTLPFSSLYLLYLGWTLFFA